MKIDDLGGRLFASTNEVADIIGSDPRTVRRMIADGSIPARKNGTRHIIPVAWLREFTGTEGAPPAAVMPDLDQFAERVAELVWERFTRIFGVLAAGTAAGGPPGPPASIADPISLSHERKSRGQDTSPGALREVGSLPAGAARG